MSKSKRKTKIAIGMSAALMLFSQNVHADTLTDLQQKKSQLHQSATQSSDKKAQLENELKQIEQEIVTLEAKLREIAAQIEKTNNEINAKEQDIQKTQQEIIKIKADIRATEIDLEGKKAKIKQNLQMMSSNGDVQFLELIFRSDSWSQFVYRFETYLNIMDKGEELHDEVLQKLNYIKEQEKLLVSKEAQLISEKSELENKKNLQVEQKNEQTRLEQQLHEKKEQVKDDIHEEEEALAQIGALLQQAENDIANEQARIAEAKRQAEEARRQQEAQRNNNNNNNSSNNNGSQNNDSSAHSNPSLGQGTLARPLAPGTYRLTSHYGYRYHPIRGTRHLHNGTDFAAPRNTPIYAAEEGYVMYSGRANGYGNWIVIKHPNGLYTIYGHMYDDGLYVRPGQYVFRGQKIGGVGSFGDSTGNHLHFCVATSLSGGRFNYANPMNYF